MKQPRRSTKSAGLQTGKPPPTRVILVTEFGRTTPINTREKRRSHPLFIVVSAAASNMPSQRHRAFVSNRRAAVYAQCMSVLNEDGEADVANNEPMSSDREIEPEPTGAIAKSSTSALQYTLGSTWKMPRTLLKKDKARETRAVQLLAIVEKASLCLELASARKETELSRNMEATLRLTRNKIIRRLHVNIRSWEREHALLVQPEK